MMVIEVTTRWVAYGKVGQDSNLFSAILMPVPSSPLMPDIPVEDTGHGELH